MSVKITINGEGLFLEKETTLQKAGQIISFLGHDQEQVTQIKVANGPSLIGPQRSQAKDAILNANAKTYHQKITTLGKYIQEQNGQIDFSPQEIRIFLQKMGDEPKNFVRDFNKAVDLSYVVSIDGSKEKYQLTDKGYEAIESRFAGEALPKSNSSKKTVSKGIRTEINDLTLVGSMEGYPDYHDTLTKADKILWLLQYVSLNNIKALTPVEVDFLSSKLQERVDQKGFTALNGRNIKKSYVISGKQGFEIQKKGIDYLLSLNKKEV